MHPPATLIRIKDRMLRGPCGWLPSALRIDPMPADDAARGHGIFSSPFGRVRITWHGDAVCRVEFCGDGEWSGFRPDAGQAGHRDDTMATRLADTVFGESGACCPVVLPPAPPFHRKVWEMLTRIPPGRVASYGALAAMLGNPGAARAVGAACAANPLAILVPCHRVVHGSGNPGGYRWGQDRKLQLLAWEFSRHTGPHQA